MMNKALTGKLKNTILRSTCIFGAVIVSIFISIQFLSASGLSISPDTPSSFPKVDSFDKVDMLIFISPQYRDDTDIETTINHYMKTVKAQLNWNIKIIQITENDNDFRVIDQTIEQFYLKSPIKACIMVGEDINTALSGDIDYLEKPSIVPWYTTGGEETYEKSEQGIVSKPYTMDICISLLYPTSTLDFQTKKSQIITAFDKFTTQRQIAFDSDILVFESSELNKHSKEIYQRLDHYGNLLYNEDPTDLDIKESLEESYSMYYVHGHSNPAGTTVSEWFSADNVDTIDTPFFAVDGCYVGGWWSNQLDNDVLDSSIDGVWYGSKIFTSEHVQVMVCGLLSQNGFSYPVNFIENAVPELLNGKNLAESMIGHVYIGSNILVYGDPTFQYNVIN